jgi:aryl-alcohol dehydrogenase-like predicted oxidoreductase
MKHRTFGRSGIKVSEVVFGGGAVGGILVHQDDATKREAIRRAIAGGINWIDTAAQYGNGSRKKHSAGCCLKPARRPISQPSSISM